MSDKPKDGGPASNMTLRDYFAGQAIAGQQANPEFLRLSRETFPPEKTKELIKHFAECAYEVADAMLAEREKRR